MLDLRWHDKSSPITIADPRPSRSPNEVVILYLGYEPPQKDDRPEYAFLE